MARPTEDDELKEARGTNRADRQARVVEITPTPERRYAPKELIDQRAKDEYRICFRQLSDDGGLADVDESLLVIYCNCLSRYLTLSKEIAEAFESGAEPEKQVLTHAETLLRQSIKLAEMFGFTPLGRGKIKPSKKKKSADETEEQFRKLMAS